MPPTLKRTIPPTPRKTKKPRKMSIPRSLKFPVPIKMRSVLRYAEIVNLTIPSAATAAYVFVANGMFDPNLTGTGHQPAGYDQLMLLYSKYTVEKAFIRVLVGQESTSNFNSIVGITTSSDNIASSIVDRYIEQPLTSYQAIKSPETLTEITQTFQAKDFFNSSYQADTDKQGTVTSNPAELVYFNVFGAPMNPGNTAGSTQLCVRIDYHVLFSDPVALSAS